MCRYVCVLYKNTHVIKNLLQRLDLMQLWALVRQFLYTSYCNLKSAGQIGRSREGYKVRDNVDKLELTRIGWNLCEFSLSPTLMIRVFCRRRCPLHH